MVSKSMWTLRALALASTMGVPVVTLASQVTDSTDLQVVSEPESLALIAVAGAAVVVARWLRRK